MSKNQIIQLAYTQGGQPFQHQAGFAHMAGIDQDTLPSTLNQDRLALARWYRVATLYDIVRSWGVHRSLDYDTHEFGDEEDSIPGFEEE